MKRHEHIEVIARGVVLHGERVLLCQNTKHRYMYLPGGHVELGEPAAAALLREMREETGLAAEAGSVLAVEEHIFQQRGHHRHELNIYFQMRLPHSPEVVPSLEAGLEFSWVPVSTLAQVDVRPAHIRDIIVQAHETPVLSWRSASAGGLHVERGR